MLVAKERLVLGPDLLTWLRNELDYPSAERLPITPEVAVRGYGLSEPFQPDPADRLIAAAALEQDCSLVTSCSRIIEHRDVATIH